MNYTARILIKRALAPLSDRLMAAGRATLEQRLIFKAARFMAADKIEGDYLEFGVFRGDSFMFAYRTLEEVFREQAAPSPYHSHQDSRDRWRLWQQMRFFAFDSFQGLPEPRGIDRLTKDFVKGKFSASLDLFQRRLRERRIPPSRVTVVPGWFEDTLNEQTRTQYAMRKAAIVYIDSDLYEPARLVLEFVTPLLQDGTVIVFDDWYSYRGNPRLGEQRACAEWLEHHPEWTLTEFQKEGPWRMSFIANTRDIPEPSAAAS